MPSGSHLPFPVDSNLNVSIKGGDSSSVDAFGRLRVSDPYTLFDSKQIHSNQPLFWDDQEISGGGTGSSHSVAEAATTISVGATTAGVRVRQTFRRFNYQPGKSQQILVTFSGLIASAGIFKACGYYDDKNGLFFESSAGVAGVTIRSYVTGSAVDTTVTQANWNIDKMDGTGESGVTLDFAKTQIGFIDFEWLGVGRVRMGFVVDGMVYYCHEFLNANNLSVVYMSTPNLPIRYEIQNDGTGAADEFVHICSSVISEGGQQSTGVLRRQRNPGIAALSPGTSYAMVGIRLQAAKVDSTVDMEGISLLSSTANDQAEWSLVFNPTVAGTFTYANETNSSVQTAIGVVTNTVTGGTAIDGGFFVTGQPLNKPLLNALKLGSSINGNQDTIVLVATPVTNNITVRASLTWRELS